MPKTKTYTKASKEELSNRIGSMKNKTHFVQLFKLINDHSMAYTKVPGKGVYIDIDKCDNELLVKIEKFLDKHYPKIINRPISDGLDTYYSEDSDFSSLRLTNQERSILRQVEQNENAISSASDKRKAKKVIIKQFS